jgi:hypothetical protein
VIAEPLPGRKIVRFGFRSSGSDVVGDPAVAVDVVRVG